MTMGICRFWLGYTKLLTDCLLHVAWRDNPSICKYVLQVTSLISSSYICKYLILRYYFRKHKMVWFKITILIICMKIALLEYCTVCFTDLDRGIKMIIFESILATFIASVIFRGHRDSCKNGFCLKSNHHKQIYSLPISVKHSV